MRVAIAIRARELRFGLEVLEDGADQPGALLVVEVGREIHPNERDQLVEPLGQILEVRVLERLLDGALPGGAVGDRGLQ
jgi:hypothetical protein